MGIFRRRDPVAAVNLTDALRLFLVERVESEAKLESAKLAGRVAELEADAKLRELRREADAARRVRRSEQSKRRPRINGKFAPRGYVPEGGCGLCLNPMRSDVTLEMITAHRGHVQ